MLIIELNQLTALDAVSAVQLGVREEILLLLSVVSQAHIAKLLVDIYYT